MTAFTTVRFRVKPGQEPAFIKAHQDAHPDWAGQRSANLIKTGDRTYALIAEWDDMDAIAAARPKMIAVLDTFRAHLEDLGGGLGVTDPVAGPVVVKLH